MIFALVVTITIIPQTTTPATTGVDDDDDDGLPIIFMKDNIRSQMSTCSYCVLVFVMVLLMEVVWLSPVFC